MQFYFSIGFVVKDGVISYVTHATYNHKMTITNKTNVIQNQQNTKMGTSIKAYHLLKIFLIIEAAKIS